MSGLSHLAGLALAVGGLGWLFVAAKRDVTTLGALAAYAVGLVAVYAASSAYHLTVARDAVIARLRLLDHIAIFLLVAGTTTPVIARGLGGSSRITVLAAIWGVALAGIVMKLTWRAAPRVLYTLLYVAMGWSVVLMWKTVTAVLSPMAMRLVIIGGITYTIGALVYATKRPDPWPGRFGFHEIWHLFVLGGSVLHFLAVALLVTT